MSRANGRSRPNGSNGNFAVTEAAFIVPAAEPIDACMWPLQPALWFQPERPPIAPAWSGLGIERQNRIPAPGFPRVEVAALNRPAAQLLTSEPAPVGSRPGIPESDLAPFGWDPRTVYRKEEGQ